MLYTTKNRPTQNAVFRFWISGNIKKTAVNLIMASNTIIDQLQKGRSTHFDFTFPFLW